MLCCCQSESHLLWGLKKVAGKEPTWGQRRGHHRPFCMDLNLQLKDIWICTELWCGNTCLSLDIFWNDCDSINIQWSQVTARWSDRVRVGRLCRHVFSPRPLCWTHGSSGGWSAGPWWCRQMCTDPLGPGPHTRCSGSHAQLWCSVLEECPTRHYNEYTVCIVTEASIKITFTSPLWKNMSIRS